MIYKKKVSYFAKPVPENGWGEEIIIEVIVRNAKELREVALGIFEQTFKATGALNAIGLAVAFAVSCRSRSRSASACARAPSSRCTPTPTRPASFSFLAHCLVTSSGPAPRALAAAWAGPPADLLHDGRYGRYRTGTYCTLYCTASWLASYTI